MKQYWQPLGTRILIKPASELSDAGGGAMATATGLLVPATAQEPPISGIIISVGKDCVLLDEGDVVLFLQHQGHILRVSSGLTYLAMDEADVIAVVREEADDDALVLPVGRIKGADYSHRKAVKRAAPRKELAV